MDLQVPKKDQVLHYYVPLGSDEELCFNVGITSPLTPEESKKLEVFFQENPKQEVCLERPQLIGENVIEFGPRPERETSFSSMALDLLKDCGYGNINRIEVSRRLRMPEKKSQDKFLQEKNFDRMLQAVYPKPLDTFEVPEAQDQLFIVSVMGDDLDLIRAANQKYKVGMSESALQHFHSLFTHKLVRNPTIEEIHAIKELSCSDHSVHLTFNSRIRIGVKLMPYTLMQLIKKPYLANPRNSVIAFCDNASAILGGPAWILQPKHPGRMSEIVEIPVFTHPSCNVETHCYPTFISPWPGAETGIGGDYRDDLAKGRGGNHLYAIAGFCMGNLWIPRYVMPWEKMAPRFKAANLASPFKIMIDAPGGTWDYGNKYGVPVYQGITRTFGMVMPNGEFYSYYKPIMMAGTVGTVRDEHAKKGQAVKGLKIISFGGRAYKIGFGGGSGSSSGVDDKNADIDFNAVQRGCAGMGHLAWRFIRACIELGLLNPIISIHDQGAAGIMNVLTELVEKSGGRINLRRVNIGDKTMVVLEILVCEYQERYGALVHPDHLELCQEIADREGCPLEVVGEVTDDGRIVFFDEKTGLTPIDLPIEDLRKGVPQQTIEDVEPAYLGGPVKIPSDLTLREAIRNVLRLPSVCSKEFHIHRADRSVTGLRVLDQTCGKFHLPVSDAAISAVDFGESFGVASAIGECPNKMMLDPRAGARMAVAEMLLNLSGVAISSFEDIKISVNWMWPAKGIPGGVAKMYFAMEALTEMLSALGIAADGGKDSSSLYARILKKLIKSPETLVLTAYAKVPDIKKFVTPDIKRPGESRLLLIDPANGQRRLGGSAFLQTLGQLGNRCPDIDFWRKLKGAVLAEQMLVSLGLIEASHDRNGDGGLFVNLLEMLMAGDCGADINLDHQDIWADLFAEEAGKIVEYLPQNEKLVVAILDHFQVPFAVLGRTTEEKQLKINFSWIGEVFDESVEDLRYLWRETSYQLDKHRINPKCALAERRNLRRQSAPPYKLTFDPVPSPTALLNLKDKPKVAILRAKVSTGDRELAAGFRAAGFAVFDVHMSDLSTGKASLDEFQGLAPAPGFSYEDVFGAGKGVAMQFWSNPILQRQAENFFARNNTFFWGTCNGSQEGAWMEVLGLPRVDGFPPLLFVRNESGGFESRFSTVEILPSPSIFFQGMEGSRLGVWVSHGEGRVWLADKSTEEYVRQNGLMTLAFVDGQGERTERYPFNPNGSIGGWTGFCDKTGRFNIMMPHLTDRAFLLRQWPWLPPEFRDLKASPWMRPLQNAYDWCVKHR
jgi:phosphoribosylformylglycinamidine synthase